MTLYYLKDIQAMGGGVIIDNTKKRNALGEVCEGVLYLKDVMTRVKIFYYHNGGGKIIAIINSNSIDKAMKIEDIIEAEEEKEDSIIRQRKADRGKCWCMAILLWIIDVFMIAKVLVSFFKMPLLAVLFSLIGIILIGMVYITTDKHVCSK